jgi:hypothetical protein
MAQSSFDAFDNRFRGVLRDCGWSLCVGAGISIGLLPSWAQLSRTVLIKAFSLELEEDSFSELVRSLGWSFDAFIQTALNGLEAQGGTPLEFAPLVEEALYGPLLEKARKLNLDRQMVAALNTPHLLSREEFTSIFEFLRNEYPQASVLSIAEVLNKGRIAGVLPNAVMTFNYDTLLEVLVRMLEIREFAEKVGKHYHPETTYRRVTGPLLKASRRIPFIYLHGCLTPTTSRKKSRSPHDSREKLVGPESSYAQLVGSPGNWPQTTFLSFAINGSLAIIGHSLSDPNLRRWLGWAAELRNREASSRSGHLVRSLPHIWITRRPSRSEHQIVLEKSLVHLGVRIAWINSWSEVGSAFGHLLSLR